MSEILRSPLPLFLGLECPSQTGDRYRNLFPLVTFMILALLDSYAPTTDIAQNIQQAVEISI
jgi:hypothetical protein